MGGYRRFFFGAWVLCVVVTARAEPRPLVLELFTSQGCSSCPPAEAYLGQLSSRPDVLALAFHVTYWDYLGWHDRFGLAQADERQNRYARLLHRSSVYTPQIVIDGCSDALGSNTRSIATALAAPRMAVPVAVAVRDAVMVVNVGPRRGAPTGEVIVAAYLRHAVSPIGRGENARRTLEEFNIVREVRTLGSWKGDLTTFRVPIATLPSDVTDVAVLVQTAGQAAIIGASSSAVR